MLANAVDLASAAAAVEEAVGVAVRVTAVEEGGAAGVLPSNYLEWLPSSVL
jgi:hypothetical protein